MNPSHPVGDSTAPCHHATPNDKEDGTRRSN